MKDPKKPKVYKIGPKGVVPVEQVIAKLNLLNHDLVLDTSTYKGMRTKCRFFCKDKSPFWRIPYAVLKGAFHHPDTTIERRNATNRTRYGGNSPNCDIKVRKKGIDNHKAKYGVEYPSQTMEFRERVKATCLSKYGVDNPTKNKEIYQKVKDTIKKRYDVEWSNQNLSIALKGAASSNKVIHLLHWKTNEDVVCIGSYEVKAVEYLNERKIDFIWQPMIFKLKSGKTYRPDLYLIKQNVYVEIKGFFRNDALEKWNEFKESYTNAELWDKSILNKMGINVK
jgi:hypothetical protein